VEDIFTVFGGFVIVCLQVIWESTAFWRKARRFGEKHGVWVKNMGFGKKYGVWSYGFTILVLKFIIQD